MLQTNPAGIYKQLGTGGGSKKGEVDTYPLFKDIYLRPLLSESIKWSKERYEPIGVRN